MLKAISGTSTKNMSEFLILFLIEGCYNKNQNPMSEYYEGKVEKYFSYKLQFALLFLNLCIREKEVTFDLPIMSISKINNAGSHYNQNNSYTSTWECKQ